MQEVFKKIIEELKSEAARKKDSGKRYSDEREMAVAEELKPCPFCGEEATLKAVNKSYGLTIWCACKCGARTEGFCPNTNKEDYTIDNIEKCTKRAIKAWNGRANDETY